MLAYLLIKTAPRSEHRLVELLGKIQNVKDLYEVYGKYDIVAKVEARNIKELQKIVFEKVKKLPGLQSCTVCQVCQIGKF
ncbi:MAG: Lrp/AsnC ligand binding domain-containing protein [Thermoplasmata archaeon]